MWPEPKSSAAGKRMLQLIDFFLSQSYEIHFASSTNFSERSEIQDKVKTHQITLNDSSFNEFISGLNPEIVIFDRFLTEEQYGWRVRESCPEAITLLDTEDLHSLRRARKECAKKNIEFSIPEWKELDDTKREMASILRTDLSLIISETELDFLTKSFNISKSLLFYLPLFINEHTPEPLSFSERKDFVTMGNFMHEPNYDSALFLKKEVWPLIRKKIPKAQLHIYGSYVTPKAKQLNQPKDGFFIAGSVENSNAVFNQARVCLAPLRFGAGVKGKFLDATNNHTPSVTTSLGIEGICEEDQFPGFVEETAEELASKAVELYSSEKIWLEKQTLCYSLKDEFSNNTPFFESLKNRLSEIKTDLTKHRNSNFMGQILTHQNNNATKYLSKWIEEKNK